MGDGVKLYLIAGEPSGDALGAALMAGLKELAPGIEFAGVGGPLMESEGLASLFPMEELSVMGLLEVLPKLPKLFRRRDEVVADVLARDADALITIDSPDFCLRVARKVKEARNLPTIHYVAPTVWAWRPERAEKMAKVIDHVLALFPFEPSYMTRAGMSCDSVGHPIATAEQATPEDVAAFKAVRGEAPLILTLPGSRRGEVARLAPVFGAALKHVVEKHPQARILVPSVGAIADQVRSLVTDWPGEVEVIAGDPEAKRAAFAAADVALAASGTVSLELAAADTPMVIAYDMNWLTRAIMRRKLLIDTVTLVNLVSETRYVPEYLGDKCEPGAIGDAVNALLEDQEARALQSSAAEITMTRLGRGREAPGLRAARSVLAHLSKR